MGDVINQCFGSVKNINDLMNECMNAVNKFGLEQDETVIAMGLVFLSVADGLIFDKDDKIKNSVREIARFYKSTLETAERLERINDQ